MRVALTGATGFIGSHVQAALLDGGHEVVALARDDAQARKAAAAGAATGTVDLFDSAAVAAALGEVDAAIHTASPGDATSADMDAAVADAAIKAFDGTGNPYLHISGIWIYGNNTAIDEDSAMDAPALVAWKAPIENRIVAASGIRGVVVVSSVVHGDGAGAVPGLLLGSPRNDDQSLVMPGDGTQHWSTVHVADLADFFVRALEDASASGYYVVGDGANATVAEITAAVADAVGAPGAVPGSADELRSRVGDYFAEVLLLDQATAAVKARALGWSPSRPTLVEDFRHGSYRQDER
jgi:nucleoside-diphosphate-sugar epimerase